MICRFEIGYPKLKGFSLNSIYAGKHWSVRKKDSNFWHCLTLHALTKAGIRKNILKKPVEITFYYNDRLDIDNHAYIEKMIVDALKS